MSVATGLETDGVQAPKQRACTPSPFPLLGGGTDESLEVLEFSQALDLVAGMAAGPLGAESVRARLPSANMEWIRHELAVVEELLNLRGLGEPFDVPPVPPLQAVLDRLRIDGSVLSGPEFVALRTTLDAAKAVQEQLVAIGDRAPHLGELAEPLPDAAVQRRLARCFDEEGELLDAASPDLAAARREVHVVRERLVRKLETIYRAHEPESRTSGVTLRNGRYVIPVRRDARDGPRGIVHDESGSSGTLFIEPTEAIELGNALREASQAEAREVHRVLRELTAVVRGLREQIEAVHQMCVAADDALARTRYAEHVQAAVPQLLESGGGGGGGGQALRLVQCRHPVLLARLPETVPFDLEFDDAERTLIVSGPNAGGKTVLLKAIGLSVALVHAGIVPPVAPETRFPLMTGLFADIGDHQSIAADLSTFSAHAAALREILENADEASLVLIDEMGSGTDPSEGAALAWAALESLTRRRTLTVATTHLGALKTLASEEPGVVNGSLAFDAATLSPSYRFSKGVPGRSYGLAIAKRLGVSAEVVARAQDRVPVQELSLDALLREAEARTRRLGEREVELGAEQQRLTSASDDVTERSRDLEARELELRDRERDAVRKARSIAQDHLLAARSQVEEAIRIAAEQGGGGGGVPEGGAREARRVVEGAIGELRRAMESAEVDAPPPHPPRSLPTLTPGSRVRLQDGVVGQVVEVRDEKVTVLAGSLRFVVPIAHVTETLAEDHRPAVAHQVLTNPVKAGADEAPLEIDLRGQRVDEAETATLAALDAAVVADHPSLKIIHGKGTGAVRERVHEVVRHDPRVAHFALAPLNEGGSGVTLVEFRS